MKGREKTAYNDAYIAEFQKKYQTEITNYYAIRVVEVFVLITLCYFISGLFNNPIWINLPHNITLYLSHQLIYNLTFLFCFILFIILHPINLHLAKKKLKANFVEFYVGLRKRNIYVPSEKPINKPRFILKLIEYIILVVSVFSLIIFKNVSLPILSSSSLSLVQLKWKEPIYEKVLLHNIKADFYSDTYSAKDTNLMLTDQENHSMVLKRNNQPELFEILISDIDTRTNNQYNLTEHYYQFEDTLYQ